MKIIKKSETYKQGIGNRIHFIKYGCCYDILVLNTKTHEIINNKIKL